MRRKTKLLLALGAAAAFTGALWPSGEAVETASVTTPESAYVLREYEGRVAVYRGGGEMATLTDIEVRQLPELDRLALHSGIAAENPRELSMLLEDLGS